MLDCTNYKNDILQRTIIYEMLSLLWYCIYMTMNLAVSVLVMMSL